MADIDTNSLGNEIIKKRLKLEDELVLKQAVNLQKASLQPGSKPIDLKDAVEQVRADYGPQINYIVSLFVENETNKLKVLDEIIGESARVSRLASIAQDFSEQVPKENLKELPIPDYSEKPKQASETSLDSFEKKLQSPKYKTDKNLSYYTRSPDEEVRKQAEEEFIRRNANKGSYSERTKRELDEASANYDRVSEPGASGGPTQTEQEAAKRYEQKFKEHEDAKKAEIKPSRAENKPGGFYEKGPREPAPTAKEEELGETNADGSPNYKDPNTGKFTKTNPKETKKANEEWLDKQGYARNANGEYDPKLLRDAQWAQEDQAQREKDREERHRDRIKDREEKNADRMAAGEKPIDYGESGSNSSTSPDDDKKDDNGSSKAAEEKPGGRGAGRIGGSNFKDSAKTDDGRKKLPEFSNRDIAAGLAKGIRNNQELRNAARGAGSLVEEAGTGLATAGTSLGDLGKKLEQSGKTDDGKDKEGAAEAAKRSLGGGLGKVADGLKGGGDQLKAFGDKIKQQAINALARGAIAALSALGSLITFLLPFLLIFTLFMAVLILIFCKAMENPAADVVARFAGVPAEFKKICKDWGFSTTGCEPNTSGISGSTPGAGIDNITCLAIIDPSLSPELRAFMRTLTFAEGTPDANGYIRLVGGQLYPGANVHPGAEDVNLFRKTGFTSDAFGKYQMLSDTWAEWADIAGVPAVRAGTNSNGEKYYDMSPKYQDLAVARFLQRAGLETTLKTQGIEAAINTNAACRWASVPGNKAGCSQKNGQSGAFTSLYAKLLAEEKSPGGCGTKQDAPATDPVVKPASNSNQNLETVARVFRGVEVVAQSTTETNKAATLDLNSIASKTGVQSIVVQEVSSKSVQSFNGGSSPASPASTIKLVVADVVLNEIKSGKLSLNQSIPVTNAIMSDTDGKIGTTTVRDALTDMLQKSGNTSTNALVLAVGGAGNGINSKMSSLGYQNTRFNNYLSLPGSSTGSNSSNGNDITKAMDAVYFGNGSGYDVAQNALRSPKDTFSHSNREANKIGANSSVIGNSSVVDIDGKKYIITVFANQNGVQPGYANDKYVNESTQAVIDSLKAGVKLDPNSSSTTGNSPTTSSSSSDPCATNGNSGNSSILGEEGDDARYFPATYGYQGPTGGQAWGAPRSYGPHSGVDFTPDWSITSYPDGAYNLPIVAYRKGKVIEVGDRCKELVILHPDGTKTEYLHNSRILVSLNQEVNAGQEIAKVGGTCSGVPHLHFMIYNQTGAPINPMPVLLDGLNPKAGLKKVGTPGSTAAGL